MRPSSARDALHLLTLDMRDRVAQAKDALEGIKDRPNAGALFRVLDYFGPRIDQQHCAQLAQTIQSLRNSYNTQST